MKTAPAFLHPPCGPLLMNGADKFAMTHGGPDPRAEPMGWLPEQPVPKKARFAAQGVSSPLFPPSPGVFSPTAVRGAAEGRMFVPTFQPERSRHVHPTPGTGTTLYYSQAPRNQTYSSFFPATYPPPMTTSAITTTSGLHDGQRSYQQVDNFQPQIGVQSSISHSQIPVYLQQQSAHPSSPAIGHNRLFQQGRSILISRFNEDVVERETPAYVRIQLSPVVQQVPEEPIHRRSTDSAHLSPTPNSPIEPAPEPLSSTPNYRMPTGKEGSLKHRILRPPSINIVDPPPTVLLDAPLSAPPIRNQREPSPKQPRSIPSSGYRSFSSSASSLVASSGTSPSGAAPLSPSPTQLKYPQSFMRGAIIQLASNQLKQVEEMTTEDFIECSALSPTLRIDSSVVMSIEKTPAAGAAKLSFQVGQDNIQITVEAPLEHPFFVYKQGWSSCSPERSAQRYGLECHKLKVGDTCISLTDKPPTTATINGTKTTSDKTVSFNSNVDKEGSRTLLKLNDEKSLAKMIAAKSEEAFVVGKRKRRWSAPDNVPPKEDGSSL